VRIQPGRYVMPPTPPPDIDVEAWERTLDEIERRGPERLALIPFGVADDPVRHLAELRLGLLDWAEFVLGGASEDEFIAYCRPKLADAGEPVDIWDLAMPFWQSYQGLKRWADKHARHGSDPVGFASCRASPSRRRLPRSSRSRTPPSSAPYGPTARRTRRPPGTTGRTDAYS